MNCKAHEAHVPERYNCRFKAHDAKNAHAGVIPQSLSCAYYWSKYRKAGAVLRYAQNDMIIIDAAPSTSLDPRNSVHQGCHSRKLPVCHDLRVLKLHESPIIARDECQRNFHMGIRCLPTFETPPSTHSLYTDHVNSVQPHHRYVKWRHKKGTSYQTGRSSNRSILVAPGLRDSRHRYRGKAYRSLHILAADAALWDIGQVDL